VIFGIQNQVFLFYLFEVGLDSIQKAEFRTFAKW